MKRAKLYKLLSHHYLSVIKLLNLRQRLKESPETLYPDENSKHVFVLTRVVFETKKMN